MDEKKDIQLTECADNTRESKEYWDKRIQDNWNKPFHGMYLDDEELIHKMDRRNFDTLLERIHILNCRYDDKVDILEAGCGNGRYIKTILPVINSYTGFDLAKLNIEEAKRVYQGNPAIELHELNMLDAQSHFIGRKFHLIFMVATLTSIQRNFYTVLKGLKTLLHKGESIFVFEQDMFIEHWGDWKQL